MPIRLEGTGLVGADQVGQRGRGWWCSVRARFWCVVWWRWWSGPETWQWRPGRGVAGRVEPGRRLGRVADSHQLGVVNGGGAELGQRGEHDGVTAAERCVAPSVRDRLMDRRSCGSPGLTDRTRWGCSAPILGPDGSVAGVAGGLWGDNRANGVEVGGDW